MNPENQFTEKVAAGAAYLDAVQPGWAERINLATLDLGSPTRCVIGQSVARYLDGIEELNLSIVEGQALGFAAERASQYEELTQAWIPVIKERQPKPSPPEIVVESSRWVSYSLKLNSDGYPVFNRITGSEPESSTAIGTTDTGLWREIGEAFITLADEQDQS